MATCQGDVPITTKVDGPTRDFVDKLAEATSVSRAELLRRLLDLYHCSEKGDLECPSCAQPVRIRPEDRELTISDSAGISVEQRIEKGADTEPERDTLGETPETGSGAIPPDVQSQVNKLESVIETQQQELEQLRHKMTAQESAMADLSESGVSPQRINQLEEQIEWSSDEIRCLIPRIEALTEVSELSSQGICPSCGDALTMEQSFVDLGDPSAIKCPDCDLIVGHQS